MLCASYAYCRLSSQIYRSTSESELNTIGLRVKNTASRLAVSIIIAAAIVGLFLLALAGLYLPELRNLVSGGEVAALQLAIRMDRSNTESGVRVTPEQVDEMAMRSVALASPKDVGWYYEGALEHLNLQNRSSWKEVPDPKLLRAFKWLEAGAQLDFLPDSTPMPTGQEA